MADLKISELSALAGSNLVAADELAIVDDSASETKKITVSDLIANGVTVISDDTIPGAKILFGAGDIATAALADAAVTTAKVADDAITAAKLGNESTVDLVTTLPGAGAFTGQLAFDTDDNKLYIWDGSAWQSLKAAGSVNTVSGSTTGEINIVSSVSGDTVTLSATIDNTSSANQFLAGPTGAAGAVGYRVIDGSDLPVSTSSAKGGVIVNGEGLRMDASTIEVDNDVTASSTHHVVTYNAKGLITGGRVLAASDLPIATASAVGGVIASTGLTVDGSGNLTIDNSVTADTYTKVTVAATGLVTAGSTLAASDLPNHSAGLLTSGNIPLARIADNLVTGAKLADYASAKIGETNPTADYIGQLFFNPLTRDLSLWDGNVFQPIGISAGEIVFAGTYNATTNLLSSVTSDGTGAGYVVGQALPAASNTNKNFYVVVDVGGTGTSPAPAVSLAPPDFVLSTGTEYKLIDVSETVTAQVASNVGFTPVGTIAANNVQTAIAEVDTEKVAKSGDTMTGDLTLNDANVVFEGSTENAFETTLTVVDPTADRTITLPNITGAVVTTGDTGTVTSTMLTDGTIVNADINASAEIAVSKLANGTARQLLQTASNGSDVEFTSNVDVPGTLDVTGAATLDSTLGVAGLISANGKVSFPLGSAAAPSLLPGADTNTGIFSPGADQLAITTGGTQRVTVDSSGHVAIGSATTTTHFSVVDGNVGLELDPNLGFSSRANTGTLRVYDRGGSAYRDLGITGANILFGINDSEKLRIDASGRLGLGTSSPTTKLHVAGDVKVVNTGIAYLQPNTVTAFQAYESSGPVKISLTNNGGATFAGGAFAIASDGDISTNVRCHGSIELDSTGSFSSPKIKLFSNTGNATFLGNVGVGTTSPSSKLEVKRTDAAGNYFYAGASSDNGIRGLQFSSSDNGVYLGAAHKIDATSSGGSIALATGGNERLRITSAGLVGIGTTSPSQLLTVAGVARFENFIEFAGSISTPGTAAAIYRPADNNLAFSTASTERLRIDSSGRLLLGTTTAATNSELTVRATSPHLSLYATPGNDSRLNMGDTDNHDIGLIAYANSDNSMRFTTNATERLRIDSSGVIKHTGSTGAGGANKLARYVVPSHNTNEEDVMVFQVENESSYNQLTFGGGTSSYNAVTQILFRTASAVDTTTGSERMRITSDAYVRLASGTGGIQFNGDTAAANALDDYEEGTWTPSIGGNATYTTQTGTYTKVGRLVYVNCNIQINAIGTGSATTITGLPFAASGGLADSSAVGYWSSGSRNVTSLMACTNSTQVVFTDTVSAVSGPTLNGGIFQNSTNLRFGLCYQV